MIALIKTAFRNLLRARRESDAQKILLGQVLSRLNESREAAILQNIRTAGFKVFSQWDDDGIIDFLAGYLDIPERSFVEFGVENYREANTRFLLLNKNWRGLVMDGSAKNIAEIRADEIYWQHEFTAHCAFLTAENINQILEGQGFTGEIGLLHIDIDGNDYWVWKAIHVVRPVLVIMEYNAVFGAENAWTVPYAPDFYRTRAHHSNLYFGSSLLSLCDLANEKGYTFVGCNQAGNNAYFVQNERLKALRPCDPLLDFVASKFREGRDRQGNLTLKTGPARLDEIRGMDVFNTRTGRIEKI